MINFYYSYNGYIINFDTDTNEIEILQIPKNLFSYVRKEDKITWKIHCIKDRSIFIRVDLICPREKENEYCIKQIHHLKLIKFDYFDLFQDKLTFKIKMFNSNDAIPWDLLKYGIPKKTDVI